MVRYAVLKGLYDIHKTIGSGGFAKVKLATHIATGEHVAIKIIKKEQLGDDLPRVEIELKALQTLSHQHICELYQVIETETHIFLIVEYCSGGELFDHIVEKKFITETESRLFFRQILSAIAYIHSLGFVHRDIKPENVLLDGDQSLKLIDFGLCAHPKGGISSPLSTSCGSPFYAAPELILGTQYLGPEVDVWSLGVLLFVILTGNLPFDNENMDALYKQILSGKYNEPIWLSRQSRNLIRSMLQTDSKKRIKIEELLSHPWVTMEIFDPIDTKSNTKRYRDDDVLEIMSKSINTTPEKLWQNIKKWNYDYDTASYLLLLSKKRRGEPLKMNKNRQMKDKIEDSSANTKLKFENVLKPITNESNDDKNKTPQRRQFLSLDQENLSPMNQFLQPAPPSSIRKPQKRIRSPNLDGDYSPVPVKLKITTDGPRTPSSERNSTCNTATTPTMTSGSARKALLGSIERGLSKVRNVLTPNRGNSGINHSIQPQTLTNKGLCNVSTTQSSNPELVISELSKALSEKNIICRRKGFTLRGRMESYRMRGCSFELEICFLPQLTPSKKKNDNLNAYSKVGIRRKRLTGDAWCYKKVCEEVLALTSTGFKPLDGFESAV